MIILGFCFRSMPVNGPPASKGRPPEAKVLAGCFFTSSVSLQEYGQIPASHYHAKMTPGQRVSVQNRWQSGQLQVSGSSGSAVFCPCQCHAGAAAPVLLHTLNVVHQQAPCTENPMLDLSREFMESPLLAFPSALHFMPI